MPTAAREVYQTSSTGVDKTSVAGFRLSARGILEKFAPGHFTLVMSLPARGSATKPEIYNPFGIGKLNSRRSTRVLPRRSAKCEKDTQN